MTTRPFNPPHRTTSATPKRSSSRAQSGSRTPTRTRQHPARSKPAFALPIVLLIAVVAVLSITAVLERQNLAQRFVATQARRYQEHHEAAGTRELLSSWLSTTGASVTERLGELDPVVGSLVFTLDLPDNGYVRAWMRDAQGSILRDPRGVGGPTESQGIIAALFIEQALENLPEIYAQQAAKDWFREVGPIAVSINTAPPEVIDAVARAMFSNQNEIDRLTRLILDERRVEPFDQRTFRQKLANARFVGVENTTILQLFTTTPELWEVIVEHRPPGPNFGTTSRWSKGLVIVAARSAGSIQGRSTSIVRWESIPDPQAQQAHDELRLHAQTL